MKNFYAIKQQSIGITQHYPHNSATYWRESAEFWRERSNAFELALRKIEALNTGNPITTNAERYKIAFETLENSKKNTKQNP